MAPPCNTKGIRPVATNSISNIFKNHHHDDSRPLNSPIDRNAQAELANLLTLYQITRDSSRETDHHGNHHSLVDSHVQNVPTGQDRLGYPEIAAKIIAG